MKKLVAFLLCTLCFAGFWSLTSTTAQASTDQTGEWSEINNINGSPITSAMLSNTKAAYVSDPDGSLYTAWAERNGSYSVIRAKKYNGSVWETIDGGTGLNIRTSMNAVDPSLIIYHGSLYIAWLEQCTTGDASRYAIYVKRYDGGTSWTRVDDGETGGICYDEFPDANSVSMQVHGDNLYAAWEEGYVGVTNYKIHVKQYNSNTNTWIFVDGNISTGINQTTDHNAFNPTLISYGGLLYATWDEQNSDLIGQIIVKSCNVDSKDGMYNWLSVSGNTETGLNSDSAKSAYCSKLFVMKDTLYAVWQENLQIWVSRFDKSSGVWSTPVSLAGPVAPQYNIAVYQNKLYLVYLKGASSYKTCVLRYDGMNIVNLLSDTSSYINTNKNYYQNPPAMAVHNNSLFVSWVEQSVSGNDSYNIKNRSMTLPHIIATPTHLNEDSLDTASLSLTLYGTSFKDSAYDVSNFTLSNAPDGLSIESVTDNSGVCTVNLAYSSIKDFDTNINNLTISVASAEITSGDDLSDTLTITANDDMESISIADDGNLWEGAEDGQEIMVTLEGGTFADTITPANWTVKNLPSGVTVGSLERVNAHKVRIKLSGNSTEDYDTNITNVSVSCSSSEYADSTGGSTLMADTGVTMQAHVETLESIAITSPASKLVYTVGDTLDISGLVVTGTYSDNSAKAMAITADNISGFDSSSPAAEQILTITVEGKTATYTVTINAAPVATLESIAITSPASKLIYTVGDTLDISGLVVTGTYSDNSAKAMAITADDISGFDSSSSAAEQILTITVEGKTATYTVTINAAPVATLESIAITSPASKLIYTVGDSLDISGLVVTGTYSDNSAKAIAITADNISGFDSSSSAAEQILTITVEGKTATYTVTINAAPVATLESIAITSPASKLIYTVGDSLDISGLVVTGTYSDNSAKAMAITADNISGFDSSSPVSEQVLTITVEGKTATYTVTINAAPVATLESIAITSPASKLVYTVGDTLDISGLVVTGTYSNGSKRVETVTGGAISGFDSSSPAAEQILTITVEGKTATYTVTINAAPAATLESIAITSPASKLVYTVGDSLDLSGLVVTGTYSDNSAKAMAITADDISGFDSSSPVSEQVLTITVEGKTATYTVTINAAPVATLESIAITSPASKLIYTVGDSLDISGLVVTGTYSDNSAKAIAITADNISGFDSSSPVSEQVLTITVEGKTATYTVTINAAPVATLESIAITSPASKLIYTVGDSLDISGLVVTGTYSDNSAKAIAITADNISGFDSSSPAAEQILTITMEGKTATYTITINTAPVATLESIAITSPASKLVYTVGDSLDLSGLVVTGTYSNGSKRVETVTGGAISGFDSSSPAAEQILTITVEGKTATYTITINTAPVATLESIAITSPASKLVYTVGDSLDLSGLVVTGTYSNGSKRVETVTGGAISGFDSSSPAAEQILTITVEGKTATYTVTINTAPVATLESIAITSPASKLVYTVGDSLDLSGLVVTGTYSDNSTKAIAIAANDISGFDSSSPVTNQVLTISIGNKATTYTITISAKSNNNNSPGSNSGVNSTSDTETNGYVFESGGVLFKVSHSSDKESININITLPPNNDHAGKELVIPIGITNIIDEITSSSAHQVNVTVTLPTSIFSDDALKQTNLDLTAEILEAVKKAGRDITVSVQDEAGSQRYSWTFSKDNLTNSTQEIGEVNLFLQVIPMNKDESINKLFEDSDTKVQNGIIISFSHDGLLPSQADIKLYVGNHLPAGSKVYLYHYDPENGKLVAVPFNIGTVDKDGYITFGILHCSQYVMLEESAAKSIITTLKNQISIPVSKTLLYAGGTKDKTAAISVSLPSTLELVTDLTVKTSEAAIGGVVISHRSGNNKVVRVGKNGLITAKGAGKVTIYSTVKLYNGESKTFKNSITVKAAYIKFTKSTSKLSVGDTFTFKAKAYGFDIKDIKWTTLKKSILTINKKTGEAKAVSAGTDYVIVTIGGKVKKIKVVVK